MSIPLRHVIYKTKPRDEKRPPSSGETGYEEEANIIFPEQIDLQLLACIKSQGDRNREERRFTAHMWRMLIQPDEDTTHR